MATFQTRFLLCHNIFYFIICCICASRVNAQEDIPRFVALPERVGSTETPPSIHSIDREATRRIANAVRAKRAQNLTSRSLNPSSGGARKLLQEIHMTATDCPNGPGPCETAPVFVPSSGTHFQHAGAVDVRGTEFHFHFSSSYFSTTYIYLNSVSSLSIIL